MVPSRLVALVRALDTQGGTVPATELWSMLFPEALRRSSVSDRTTPAMGDELRREAIALGIVEAAGSSLRITDSGRD